MTDTGVDTVRDKRMGTALVVLDSVRKGGTRGEPGEFSEGLARDNEGNARGGEREGDACFEKRKRTPREVMLYETEENGSDIGDGKQKGASLKLFGLDQEDEKHFRGVVLEQTQRENAKDKTLRV